MRTSTWIKRLTLFALCLAPLLQGAIMTAEAQVVRAPQRTQGLVATPAQDDHKLVSLKGPGLFVAAEVVKQGGDSDLTFVSLDIDGQNVTSISFAAAGNVGLTEDNPFGLVLLQASGDPQTLTIGFESPLEFRSELVLSVSVQESGVAQILGNVIHGVE